MNSTETKTQITVEPTAVKARAKKRAIFVELTVPGIVAGHFQLRLEE